MTHGVQVGSPAPLGATPYRVGPRSPAALIALTDAPARQLPVSSLGDAHLVSQRFSMNEGRSG
jgi:hypothetical protein